MTQRLTISQILVYYDFPEIFIATNQVETTFLCLLVSTEQERTAYISTPISKRRLSDFIKGTIDLRDIFEKPEVEQWYFFDEVDEVIVAKLWEGENLPQEYLPETGFVFHKQLDGEELILVEAVEKNNAIVHIAVSDDKDDFSIEADDLGDIVKLYQTILEHSYKKSLSEKKVKDKKFYFTAPNYKLRAFASSYSSFNLHFYSTSQIDLFGNAIIEIGLSKFDEIVRDFDNQDEYIKSLRSVKGHAISTLRKFVKKLIDENIKVKHKWYSPNQETVHFTIIDKSRAEKIFEVLNLTEELAEETKTFIGYFVQVDIDNGTWRIHNLEDNKEYSGQDKGHNLLGVTVETVNYKLTCQEVIEELKVTEKEKVQYILQAIEIVE